MIVGRVRKCGKSHTWAKAPRTPRKRNALALIKSARRSWGVGNKHIDKTRFDSTITEKTSKSRKRKLTMEEVWKETRDVPALGGEDCEAFFREHL